MKRKQYSKSDPFGLFLKRGFLNQETCARIRDEARAVPGHPAPVYIEGSSDLVHETVRKTTSVEISQSTIDMVYEQLFAQTAALAEHFRLELHDCEPPQFLLYRPGDFFVRHQDGNSEQLEFDHLRVRKISIVVFLNQATAEPEPDGYGGGSLVFYAEPDRPEKAPKVRELIGETGLLVGFAAHTTHEVTPVTHGERFAIVSWFK